MSKVVAFFERWPLSSCSGSFRHVSVVDVVCFDGFPGIFLRRTVYMCQLRDCTKTNKRTEDLTSVSMHV